jgi:predicted Zn finger-like uncharacterized protein
MILTCPNCGTQYAVKDGAIPPLGRQVRCAACKHSWHQDPEDGAAPAEEPEAAAGPDVVAAIPAEEAPIVEASEEHGDEDESLAEATLIEPRSGPEAEERAYEEAMVDEAAPEPLAVEETPAPEPVADEPLAEQRADDRDEFSPFAYREDSGAERGKSKLLPILIVVLIIIAAAAAFWFLAPPEWKARIGLAGAGMSPLALVTTHMDRQRLESGNELLTVSGRVINPTTKEQTVPPLQAQLRAKGGKLVYSWTIAPPARTLPPGASASFNSAEVNVPPGGDELTITVGSGNI